MSNNTPSYKPKELIKLLEKKGFIFDRASGSHYLFMLPDGSKRVIVPMHNKDLPAGTLHNILKQAGIDKNEL
jgi:predicted RNA binding protein YcfA (HicA-like mRNA interferase family)